MRVVYDNTYTEIFDIRQEIYIVFNCNVKLSGNTDIITCKKDLTNLSYDDFYIRDAAGDHPVPHLSFYMHHSVLELSSDADNILIPFKCSIASVVIYDLSNIRYDVALQYVHGTSDELNVSTYLHNIYSTDAEALGYIINNRPDCIQHANNAINFFGHLKKPERYFSLNDVL